MIVVPKNIPLPQKIFFCKNVSFLLTDGFIVIFFGCHYDIFFVSSRVGQGQKKIPSSKKRWRDKLVIVLKDEHYSNLMYELSTVNRK